MINKPFGMLILEMKFSLKNEQTSGEDINQESMRKYTTNLDLKHRLWVLDRNILHDKIWEKGWKR